MAITVQRITPEPVTPPEQVVITMSFEQACALQKILNWSDYVARETTARLAEDTAFRIGLAATLACLWDALDNAGVPSR